MKTIRQRYANKPTEDLMWVLENPDHYTQECFQEVELLFLDRQVSEEEISSLAIDLNRKKIREQLDRFDPINDEVSIQESYFLSPKEVKRLYQEELKLLIERKDGFRFDVWQYAIGGVV
jgi:hypothetical protein